jgi:hypothetical protein
MPSNKDNEIPLGDQVELYLETWTEAQRFAPCAIPKCRKPAVARHMMDDGTQTGPWLCILHY